MDGRRGERLACADEEEEDAGAAAAAEEKDAAGDQAEARSGFNDRDVKDALPIACLCMLPFPTLDAERVTEAIRLILIDEMIGMKCEG